MYEKYQVTESMLLHELRVEKVNFPGKGMSSDEAIPATDQILTAVAELMLDQTNTSWYMKYPDGNKRAIFIDRDHQFKEYFEEHSKFDKIEAIEHPKVHIGLQVLYGKDPVVAEVKVKDPEKIEQIHQEIVLTNGSRFSDTQVSITRFYKLFSNDALGGALQYLKDEEFLGLTYKGVDFYYLDGQKDVDAALDYMKGSRK